MATSPTAELASGQFSRNQDSQNNNKDSFTTRVFNTTNPVQVILNVFQSLAHNGQATTHSPADSNTGERRLTAQSPRIQAAKKDQRIRTICIARIRVFCRRHPILFRMLVLLGFGVIVAIATAVPLLSRGGNAGRSKSAGEVSVNYKYKYMQAVCSSVRSSNYTY